MTQLVSPSRPEVVAQMAVARLVCRPDDWRPSGTRSTTSMFTHLVFVLIIMRVTALMMKLRFYSIVH